MKARFAIQFCVLGEGGGGGGLVSESSRARRALKCRMCFLRPHARSSLPPPSSVFMICMMPLLIEICVSRWLDPLASPSPSPFHACPDVPPPACLQIPGSLQPSLARCLSLSLRPAPRAVPFLFLFSHSSLHFCLRPRLSPAATTLALGLCLATLPPCDC